MLESAAHIVPPGIPFDVNSRLCSNHAMESGRLAQVAKWLGLLTAILALITGISKIVTQISERSESRKKVDALVASEQLQLQAHDYRAAWLSLEQAYQINPNSPKIQAEQEKLAMTWLDNFSIAANEKISDITVKLEPVLTRGIAASAPGERQADLLAHLGWSYYLRSRDGSAGPDPVASYAKAVEMDRANPFAHAMWGYSIISSNGKLTEAMQHFAAASDSRRESDFVRFLQLKALLNCQKEPCDEEIIRVLSAMRKQQQRVSLENRSRIFSLYYFKLLVGRADSAGFVHAVAPEEHLATFRWLFDDAEFDESRSLQRTYYIGALEEAAGQRSEALATYKWVHSKVASNPCSLLDAVNGGIQRLSRP